MNEGLYEDAKAHVLAAMTRIDNRTTLAQARHIAHDTVFEFFSDACEVIRELDEVTLESVLLQFGQRVTR